MHQIFDQLNPWWQNQPIDTKIPRPKYLEILKKNIENDEILMLLGCRRVGKTTIMKQWIDYLLKNQNIKPANIFFVLLDHPGLKNIDLTKIIDEYYTLKKVPAGERVFVFLDEIQYKKNWDQEIKSLYETRKIKFVLSGSAVSLISRQKNFLTGRYLKYIVQPLDFDEFTAFTGKDNINDYLLLGGYPEYVINQDPQYLIDLVDAIVYKDVVEIYKIRQPGQVKDMLSILARAVGHKISLNKIAKTIKISIETVKDYLRYLSEVYLIYEVPKFSRSLNEQIYNEKKYYFYDTGLVKNLSGMDNLGCLAENATANYLKNKGNELSYFYENKSECDFMLKKMDSRGNFVHQPIEVKFKPTENTGDEFDKEQKGLKGFFKAISIDNSALPGIIVTRSSQGKYDNFELMPLEKFLRCD